jgi:hypothetical protein
MTQDTEIKCPTCGGSDLNMTGEPVVTHSPPEHGWYGQWHTVAIEMFCECGQLCSIRIDTYKGTAQLRVIGMGSLENVEASK